MSEINAPATLVTPAGTVTFNPTSPTANYIWLTDVQGLDGVSLRAPIDPKPLADGGIVHDFLEDVRHVTISGIVVATSAAARNSLCDQLTAALASIRAADGSYSWTPTGSATKHLAAVRCDQQILGFNGGAGFTPKAFVFGLVAADPTIT